MRISRSTWNKTYRYEVGTAHSIISREIMQLKSKSIKFVSCQS